MFDAGDTDGGTYMTAGLDGGGGSDAAAAAGQPGAGDPTAAPGVFSELTADLQERLRRDMAQIRFLLSKNPGMGYARIVEVGKEVGKRYNIKLIVNFPKEGRIEEFDMYGKRDLSLIVDYERKRFPIDRQLIKDRAVRMLGDVKTEDAYMYENKEGVRVYTDDWKIDILPHSVHIWTEFDGNVTAFCDWLMENAYKMRRGSAPPSTAPPPSSSSDHSQ